MSSPADRKRSRHRAPPPPQRETDEFAGHDVELDSYLAALAPATGPDATELTARFGSAQVIQLRLPALRLEQLRRIAAERGASPGALVMDWVIEQLDREDDCTGPLPVVEDEPRKRGLLRFGKR